VTKPDKTFDIVRQSWLLLPSVDAACRRGALTLVVVDRIRAHDESPSLVSPSREHAAHREVANTVIRESQD
jgi:hypothetical protein